MTWTTLVWIGLLTPLAFVLPYWFAVRLLPADVKPYMDHAFTFRLFAVGWIAVIAFTAILTGVGFQDLIEGHPNRERAVMIEVISVGAAALVFAFSGSRRMSLFLLVSGLCGSALALSGVLLS